MKKRFAFSLPILLLTILLCFTLSCCRGESSNLSGNNEGEKVDFKYATQVSVEKYSDGFVTMEISDGLNYLIVPEGGDPEEFSGDISDYAVIYKPLNSVYLAASSAMDLFDALGSLDKVKMTSTKDSDWGLYKIKDLVFSGEIEYIGKYSAPDYEAILSNECDLAIESTMIYHHPEVKEAIESLEIPVMVERSSYESHPLGRLEWIKVYGILFDKEEEAGKFFNEKDEALNLILEQTEKTEDADRPKVAFFSISANNYATVRKPGDYVSQMIYMAGGKYAMEDLPVPNENALSTTNIQLESLLDYVMDADIIIYNGTIQGEIMRADELLDKFGDLSATKAVKEGTLWCTSKDLFQGTSGICEMIEELNIIITGADDGIEHEWTYFYKLTS